MNEVGRRPIRLPGLLYYSLVTIATELILVAVSVLILFPTGRLATLPLGLFGFLLAFKTIMATLAVFLVGRNRWQQHLAVLRGGGMLLGWPIGLILGGLVGSMYAGIWGAILGAVAVYFVMGRIGAWVSVFVGCQLDKMISTRAEPLVDLPLRPVKPGLPMFLTYVAGIPIGVMVLALLWTIFNIPRGGYPDQQPVARLVVIILSLVSLLLPWFLRRLWVGRPSDNPIGRANAIFFLGMATSIAPTVYGLFLFISFGISLVEMGVFATFSFLSALLWYTIARSHG